MILFIKGQDIKEVEFALIDGGAIVHKTKKTVSPERQLFELDAFLNLHSVSLSDITKVFVVSGPGSFTSSRLSVVIANTISFVQDIPVVSIENKEDLSIEELAERLMSSTGSDNNTGLRFASPTYNMPPRITQSKQV